MEEVVALAIEIPIPAVNVFCLAARKLFGLVVSIEAANAFVSAVFVT